MIDETASSDGVPTRQRVSVLYDAATGQAVYGHTFVGVDDELSGPDGRSAREQVMRAAAGPDRVGGLRFADAPAGLEVDGPAMLEVVDDVVRATPLRLRRRNVDAESLRGTRGTRDD